MGTLTVFGGGSVPARVKVSRSGRFDARFAGDRTVIASRSSAGEPLRVPARPRRPVVPSALR